jgi:TetR/AcrR family transcriptional repressor of nem operon
VARTRAFVEEQVVERAMRAFWRRGYPATSLEQLLGAMKLSKSSFYEAFGTKRGLLVRTLDRYAQSSMAGLLEPLQRPHAARAEIEQVFAGILDHATSRDGRRGCFVNNCVADTAVHDPVILAAVRGKREALERSLAAAVQRGQARGEISDRDPPGALARFLANTLSGINLSAKMRPNRQQLEDIVRIALRSLD